MQSLFEIGCGDTVAIRDLLIAQRTKRRHLLCDTLTPLYIASQNGHFDVVKALLACRSDVNQAINQGSSPLFIATQEGVVRILLPMAPINVNQGVVVRARYLWRPNTATAMSCSFSLLQTPTLTKLTMVVRTLRPKRAILRQRQCDGQPWLHCTHVFFTFRQRTDL